MTLQDPAAFAFLCAALVLLSVSRGTRWASSAFLLLNLAFLALVYGSAWKGLGILLAAECLHFGVLRLMMRTSSESARAGLFLAWLLATLAGFFVVKEYWWITDLVISRSALPRAVETVGYSFLLFRQIHLGVEARDGVRRSLSFIDYLNYTLAFWTFVAGPIQRVEAFLEQFSGERRSLPDRDVLLGLNRVMLGFIKMFVIGQWLGRRLGAPVPSPAGGLHAALPLVLFPLHMYVNFSGYCDIMIGFARAVGFTLPENFRHPYLARNSLDFWSHWHITLSEFFRDYVYFPLYTSMSRRLPALSSAIAATLVSFALMGAWHGNSARFAVFGLVHACGVVTTLVYQRLLKRMLTKAQLRRYAGHRAIHVVAVLAFQSFVVLSFVPFQYELRDVPAVLRSVMPGGAR